MTDIPISRIFDAYTRLMNVAVETPLVSSSFLGTNMWMKAENLQKTGSFKLRGAFYKIDSLTDEQISHGVIACSAGNHAQGVALAATKRGIKSVICMPANAPKQKIKATEEYGGQVILVEGNYDAAAKEAMRLRDEYGYTLVHPFDDPFVIAGQGTIGYEILYQKNDVQQIIVPIGGGGLISGIGLLIKTIKPSCKIIGVQAKDVPSMYTSIAANKITTVSDNKTIADGIHVLTPGDLTFEMVNKYVDNIVTVSEDEIADAMVKLVEYPKIVAEGAGAVSVAAYINGKVDKSLKTVCVVSGGNVDVSLFYDIIKANIGKHYNM